MSVISKKARDKMANTEFADPMHRKYPIPDKQHAIVALGFAKMHGASPKVVAAIKKKAKAKGVDVDDKGDR